MKSILNLCGAWLCMKCKFLSEIQSPIFEYIYEIHRNMCGCTSSFISTVAASVYSPTTFSEWQVLDPHSSTATSHCLLNSVMFKHEAVCISQKKPSPPVPSLYWVCFSLFRWAISRKISGQEPIFTQNFSFTFLYIIHFCVRATSFSKPPVYYA